MKPAPFAYLAPRSVDEALAHLAEHGSEARPLAGGQSLVRLMNTPARDAVRDDRHQPRSASSPRIAAENGAVRIGAVARQRACETSPHVRDGRPAVRRGGAGRSRTRPCGGAAPPSAAWRSPTPRPSCPPRCSRSTARSWPAAPGGERTIAADDFFTGAFTTSLAARRARHRAARSRWRPGRTGSASSRSPAATASCRCAVRAPSSRSTTTATSPRRASRSAACAGARSGHRDAEAALAGAEPPEDEMLRRARRDWPRAAPTRRATPTARPTSAATSPRADPPVRASRRRARAGRSPECLRRSASRSPSTATRTTCSSSRARCCSTSCATSSPSPAPTPAASTASAARARCSSTASRRASCLMFAAQLDGAEVTHGRVARLGRTARCTRSSRRSPRATACSAASARPGMLMATVELLEHTPLPEPDDVREALVGQPVPLHRLPEHRQRRVRRRPSSPRARAPPPPGPRGWRHELRQAARRAGPDRAPGPALGRQERPAQGGPEAAHRPRAVHRRRHRAPGCSTAPSCAARTPTPASARSTRAPREGAPRRRRGPHRRRRR